jgi:integrin beta 3
VLEDGGRFHVRRYRRGDHVKEFREKTAAMIYRGVFDGRTYEPGDNVTWGGNLWICIGTTSLKPDFTAESAKYWTLAVKEGRRGKDGKDGKDGAEGKQGPPGRDGQKW